MFLVVISILVVVICCVSFLCGVYNLCIRKRSNGSPVQNQSDHQQRITVQQLNDQIRRLRPYDLPIMDSIVQDQRTRRFRRPRTTVIGDLQFYTNYMSIYDLMNYLNCPNCQL